MTSAAANQQPGPDSFLPRLEKRREASLGQEPTALSAIYREQTNIAIWQRELSEELNDRVATVLASRQVCETAMRVTPETAAARINKVLGSPTDTALSLDIAELVEMFCCLFGVETVGMRLTALTRAMCPKFHVDNVPCRLVTTYQGVATEWLPHGCVDRSRLGAGSRGKPDCESGLYTSERDIRQLSAGDVALLKGELWEGNEKAGLVHRSPAVPTGESRLLLTLDIVC